MFGRTTAWLLAALIAAGAAGVGVAYGQEDTHGHGSEADDAWGTGFEDDDTFGDTDALDRTDEEGEDEAGTEGETPDGDSWGTGFEDDDTFGDTDAFAPDTPEETPPA